MESQLHRNHGHHYDQQDPHNPAAGLHYSGVEKGEDDENHQEKKSVLKKVKAKAKKIKNTLTKHGHDHEHDGYEDEDGDNEEVEEDPEIHGAPMYESAAARSKVRVPEVSTGPNLERPSLMAEDRYDSEISDPPVKPFGQWQEKEEHGQDEGKLGGSSHLPGNYGTDVHNTAGKNKYKQEGSRGDRKIGVPTTMEGIRGGLATKTAAGEDDNLGRIGTNTGMEEDPHSPSTRGVPSHVQAKATDPAGIGSEEVVGITPILHSFGKMGIYDNPEQNPKTGQVEKPYTGSHDQFAPEPVGQESSDSFLRSYNASNAQDMPWDTLTGDPSNQGSTYTDKIASATATATSAIADTAKSAKNVVASKLGYGETETNVAPQEPGDTTKPASATGAAADYAQKAAATVTETLAPVYGKVSGAGSAVMSKMTNIGSGTAGDHEYRQSQGRDKGISLKEYWAEKLRPGEEDKALSEVITDTLKKPTSETEVKKTAEVMPGSGERGISEMISDAIHKREPEISVEEERKPMGKVTESEEVAKRLGTGGGKAEELGGGGATGENVGVGKGMMDRIRGVVGSWVGGRGGEAQSSLGTTYAGDNEGAADNGAHDQGGRRLHESSN